MQLSKQTVGHCGGALHLLPLLLLLLLQASVAYPSCW
jgi:hypothetical protein